MNNIKKKYATVFLFCISLVTLLALFATPSMALTDTDRPTIISTTPANNKLDVPTDQIIKIKFSEVMDPSTINDKTIILTQQTTPDSGSTTDSYQSRQIEGKVSYNGDTATFTPLRESHNPMQPNQKYGNVFTARITKDARDLAGNSLAQDYIWSFSTGKMQFNTGAATTQLSQQVNPNSPNPINTQSGTTTTNPGAATGNVVNSQSSNNTNNFSWGWGSWVLIVAGLLLVGLLVTMFVVSPLSKKKKMSVSKTVTTKNDDSFGDIYPVKNIEGIGTKYSAALNKIGIMNTKQLWKANAVKTALVIDAPLTSVKSWQNMAELASVNDIGPQYAELLERSGIHNLGQLRNYDSEKLLQAINKKQESLEVNIQGNSPGIITVENWIDQAKNHSISQQEGQTA